jgi:hypothetical protein
MEIDPEAADATQAKGCIDDVRVSIDSTCVWRKSGQNGILDINAIERPFGERQHSAVDADRRRRTCDEQQIAATARRQEPKPSFYARMIAG